MRGGWYGESFRHRLAAQGVKTNRYMKRKKPLFAKKGSARTASFVTESPEDDSVEDVYGVAVDTDEGFLSSTLQEVLGGHKAPSALRNLKGEQALKKEIVSDIKSSRLPRRVLALVEKGQPSQAVMMLKELNELQDSLRRAGDDPSKALTDLNMTQADVEATKTALNQYALQRAQADMPIERDVLEQLDPYMLNRVTDVSKARLAQDVEDRKPELIKRFEQDVLPGAISEALDTSPGFEATEKMIEGVWNAKNPGGQGLIGRIDDGIPGNDKDLADSPFITTNAFIGNEEQNPPSLDPIKFDVPSLSSNFDFVGAGPGTNPVFQQQSNRKLSPNELVDNQIRSLLAAKDKLSKVDLSKYEEGNKAFEAGDREGLLAAIVDLKGEEATLQDRFKLINMTRRNMASLESYGSAFDKGSDNIFLDLVRGRGGDKIAKQTADINEVRSAVVDAANQAHSRRKLLEYRLQRLDSVVPPESDVPGDVKRLRKPKGFVFENPLFGADGARNVVFGGSDGLD